MVPLFFTRKDQNKMDYIVPKSFRSQPVKIKVGSSQREIEIKDLSYGKHQEFMALITGIQLRIRATLKFEEVADSLIVDRIRKGEQPIDAANSIAAQINKNLLDMPNNERVKLLTLLTGEQLTEKEIVDDIETDEFFQLLQWLIEKNLRAEKNFEASLNTILNQKSQNEQK
jgi:hypothetical protein